MRPMRSTAVWLNGSLVDPDTASVSVFDHGFTVGDGVFETLKSIGGVPFAVRRHLERLRHGAERLGLDVPLSDPALRSVLDEVVTAAGVTEARVRVTVTGGVGSAGTRRSGGRPTLVVAAAPLDPWPAETTAVTVPWPRNDMAALAGVKVTSFAENVHVLAEARKVDASEAIMPNTRGNLCEGTGTNVFAVVDGLLVTPPLMAGCLPGVTRALVLEVVPEAEEDDVPMLGLADADEVLLTSTTRDVQPLRMLDGRPLPGADGPWAQRAMDALADLQARNLDP
jgi:branched-chain amino acid aminotransferase